MAEKKLKDLKETAKAVRLLMSKGHEALDPQTGETWIPAEYTPGQLSIRVKHNNKKGGDNERG